MKMKVAAESRSREPFPRLTLKGAAVNGTSNASGSPERPSFRFPPALGKPEVSGSTVVDGLHDPLHPGGVDRALPDRLDALDLAQNALRGTAVSPILAAESSTVAKLPRRADGKAFRPLLCEHDVRQDPLAQQLQAADHPALLRKLLPDLLTAAVLSRPAE